MNCLLDTHVVLWFLGDNEKLSKAALNTILEPANEKYVSIASAWELAIKIGLGKLKFDGGVDNFFKTISDNGFFLLPIKEEHIKQVEKLPFLHRDPFDRLLVASVLSEDMSLITADENIHRYDIPCIW